MFRKNFPFIVRNEEEALKIINNPENKIIEVNDACEKLIGVSIIHKNTILMLCVLKEYRHRGIGNKLLNDSENYILEKGYNKINIGVGENYLMPGIPMRTKPYEEELNEDKIYPNVTNDSYDFFSKRGYFHSWKDANCFDMRADLEQTKYIDESIGDTINEITYSFATLSDIPKIIKCTEDAEPGFTKYYKNEKLYSDDSKQKVLIATYKGEVCGTLIISIETEANKLGSVGCTTVANKYRGKHIGVNMVVLGTKYLKSLGLKDGYLGYTYSGLDKMYGYAGYKICIYYAMAQKKLTLQKKKAI
jgi:ribosomal protein S18 acetylase RimI-like enzyme